MIKTLTIKNFQSHENSKLKFSPGFNVIVGASDHGKTSIIRAIEWLRTNSPGGDSFKTCYLRDGEDESKVILENSAGTVIRTRGKTSTGSYKTYLAGKIQNYSVLGNDVPEPVIEILNLTDINVQMQLEPHFLLLQTPGQAAKYLNGITKLDKLTNALDIIKRRLASAGTEIDNLNKQIDNANQYLESGIQDVLQELEFIQKNITRCIDRRNNVVNSISSLQKIIAEIKWVKSKIIDSNEIDKVGKILDAVSNHIETAESKRTELETIEQIIRKCKSINITIKEGKLSMKQIEKELLELRGQLTKCPYCDSVLTVKTKENLLKSE